MAETHRFERLGKAIAERIDQRTKMLAAGLKGDSKQPPYTVRLTKQEQLEQYFALDEQKWTQLIQERGLAEVLEYSQAMQKLVDETFGPVEPTTVMLAPQQYAALGEMPGQPGQQPQPGQPTPDLTQLTEGLQPDQVNVQSIVNQALSSVGLDPSQVGV